MTTIDLNSDLGEGFGAWTMGADEAMLDVVSSANIACGAHAGDPSIMLATARVAGTRQAGDTGRTHGPRRLSTSQTLGSPFVTSPARLAQFQRTASTYALCAKNMGFICFIYCESLGGSEDGRGTAR